jgi:microcystin-dependent protein
MSEAFLGEIRMFGGNFAPVGWATCDGQLVQIVQNSALYAVIGTYFGGNGTSNFALPDLRGRVAIHWGTGTGLSPYTIGQHGGAEAVTLTVPNLPGHTHVVTPLGSNSSQNTTNTDPTAGFPGTSATQQYAPSSTGAMGPAQCGSTGAGAGHANIQPFLAVTFIIATTGYFPVRN